MIEVTMTDRARSRPAAAAALFLLVAAAPATAQVLRELPPVELEYVLLHGEPAAAIGSATFSAKPVDTQRGRRLEIKSRIEYTIPRQTPFAYEEEATLLCDAKGVVRFDTVARALGDERVNVGVRMGEDYQVTTTFQGKKHTKQITAGVQRTNFGLFCAAYLQDDLEADEIFSDFPLLFPVGGDHKARQLFREGVLPFEVAKGQSIPVTVCRIEKQDKTSDRIFNATKGHRILLRMEESTSFGRIVYELVRVNGVRVAESKLLK